MAQIKPKNFFFKTLIFTGLLVAAAVVLGVLSFVFILNDMSTNGSGFSQSVSRYDYDEKPIAVSQAQSEDSIELSVDSEEMVHLKVTPGSQDGQPYTLTGGALMIINTDGNKKLRIYVNKNKSIDGITRGTELIFNLISHEFFVEDITTGTYPVEVIFRTDGSTTETKLTSTLTL